MDLFSNKADSEQQIIIRKAINNYLELYRGQVRQIEKGIEAAEAGNFSTDDEIQAAIAKWTQ